MGEEVRKAFWYVGAPSTDVQCDWTWKINTVYCARLIFYNKYCNTSDYCSCERSPNAKPYQSFLLCCIWYDVLHWQAVHMYRMLYFVFMEAFSVIPVLQYRNIPSIVWILFPRQCLLWVLSLCINTVGLSSPSTCGPAVAMSALVNCSRKGCLLCQRCSDQQPCYCTAQEITDVLHFNFS